MASSTWSLRPDRFVSILGLSLAASLAGACASEPPSAQSYFSERLAPMLQTGCVFQTTGCHLPSTAGTAAGNLDLTSYDALMRRRDLLPRFGPYPFGGLLMKVSPPVDVAVNTLDPPDPARPEERVVHIQTDVRHAAGGGISLGSTGAALLTQWINSGFARQGGFADQEANIDPGACVHGIGPNDFQVARFQSGGAIDDPMSFEAFVRDVQPVLRDRCAGANCHGSRLRSLFLSCGETEEEQRWNYFVSTWHLATPVFQSEILRRPLAMDRGGDFHGGGDVFHSTDDPGYVAIERWARELVERMPSVLIEDYATDGFRFFVNRVQPVLVRKGCMLQNCHSHVSQNQDLQLFAGSQGYFGRAAQHRNHGAVLGLLALETTDPNVSRIIAKNLFPPEQVPGGAGIAHRGGSLLEDFAGRQASLAECASFDLDHGDLNTIPAYCILARYQQVERQVAIDSRSVGTELLSGVVYVSRPLGVGEATDFDTYRPGADLMLAPATMAADDSVSLAPARSLLGGCGLDRATADVRRPAVSWDGTRIAFAARSSASEPLRLYWMNADGTSCGQIPGVAPAMTSENGILTHDFDPAFAPDGQLVFASTRGHVDRAAYDYQGPTRTPASMEPNANLYVSTASGVRELTFLLDQETTPSFTAVGRVIYMGEKRQPGFHQLALRQQNLDGGDFRPAFGQRESVGFNSATEPVSLLTRDLAFVAGPLHSPDGAGVIVIANQSVGVDQGDRDPGDRLYLHSLRRPLGSVVGAMGMFRSPAALPGRFILVSCALSARSPADAPFDFDLCELDPATGATRVVGGEAGRAEIEAVGVYAHYRLPIEFILPSDGERLDRPTIIEGMPNALVTFHDFQMQMGLLFDNTRGPRILERQIAGFDALEQLPPPPEARTFADVMGNVVMDDYGSVYVRRRRLGHVDLLGDASAFVRVPAGTPLLWRPTDGDGSPLVYPAGGPFAGVAMMPREADQYYPSEHSRRGIARGLFNKLCGWCHAGMSGRELDVSVSLDIITRASQSFATAQTDPIDLAGPPSSRGPSEGP